MKQRILLSSLFLISACSLSAKPRTIKQAQKIAQEYASRIGLDKDMFSQASTRTATEGTPQNYYIFNDRTKDGFVIVSGDDRFPDIIGYSTQGTFDESSAPEALKCVLATFNANVDAVNAGKVDISKMVSKRRQTTRAYNGAIKPIVQTTWGQAEPYNRLAPMLDNGQHAVTGCVATSMAQAISVYKYPSELLADIPAYQSYGADIYDIPAIKAGEKYDWDNIINNYNDGYNDAQGDAVARLMYHCGTSVEMGYGYESGAIFAKAVDALVKYFGMDPDLTELANRDRYTLDQWIDILDTELVAGRPMMYGGQTAENSGAGHAFICDGKDVQGLYHINWGWDGRCDGYYDISILDPYPDDREEGFIYRVLAVIGITPDNGVKDEPLIEPLDVSLVEYNHQQPELVVENGIRSNEHGEFKGHVFTFIENSSAHELPRVFTLGMIDSKGQIIKIGNSTHSISMPMGLIWDLNMSFCYPIPVGTKQLCVLMSKDDGDTWELIDGSDKFPIEIIVTETELMSIPRNPGFVTPLDDDLDEMDLTAMRSVLHGNRPDWLKRDAVDMNRDGHKDGFDYVAAVNVFNGKDVTSPNKGADITMTIPQLSIKTGETADLNINIINPEQEFTYLQLDITLPEGVSIKKGRYDSPIIKLNKERLYDDDEFEIYDDHQVSYCNTNGTHSIIIYSNSNTPFKGTSGTVATIRLTVSSNMQSGSYEFKVRGLASDINCTGNDELVISRKMNISDGETSVNAVTTQNSSLTFFSIDGIRRESIAVNEIVITEGKKRIIKN